MYKQSSGEKTGSALIYTGDCLYYGFVCLSGGSDRDIKLYDALTATGTVVESFGVDGDKRTDGHSHANPVECHTGLYLEMSGGTVVVYYQPTSKRISEAQPRLFI